jgi:hypothetical protein
MKNTKRFLITSALLLLCAYSTYTTICIQKLQSRLHEEQVAHPTGPTITYGLDASRSQTTYAFDDSFRAYFGEKGVAEVERALEIASQHPIVIKPELGGNNVDLDFLTDPLRVDER